MSWQSQQRNFWQDSLQQKFNYTTQDNSVFFCFGLSLETEPTCHFRWWTWWFLNRSYDGVALLTGVSLWFAEAKEPHGWKILSSCKEPETNLILLTCNCYFPLKNNRHHISNVSCHYWKPNNKSTKKFVFFSHNAPTAVKKLLCGIIK